MQLAALSLKEFYKRALGAIERIFFSHDFLGRLRRMNEPSDWFFGKVV